jgi:Aldehyde dehydrogenase family
MVAADGAPTLKRMNLELGGKTPMIVFDDADLDTAIPMVASAVTTFAGQFCMTGSRILVQSGVADEVRARLGAIFEGVRLGNGLDPDTDMGPLIDKANVARVDGMVEAALAYAKPIVRGGPATEDPLAQGAFYRPALLEVDDVNSEIVQKEVFGAVATFEVFDTEAGWHHLDQRLGDARRRVRRGRLQPERGRSPARLPRHRRVPRSQDRRPLCPGRRQLTRTTNFTPPHEPRPHTVPTQNRRSCEYQSHRDRRRVAPEPT